MIGNAPKYNPILQERQRRLAANPEYLRRREMYRRARGVRKDHIGEWNRQWAVAGYPGDFPDFETWWSSEAARNHRELCNLRSR